MYLEVGINQILNILLQYCIPQMSQEATAPKQAAQPTLKKRINKRKGQPVRLWVRAKFLGFRRSIVNQNENQAILRLEGVRDRKDTDWYFGKRVVYVAKHGSKNFKTIWGKIAKSHGNGGAVLARFAHNLPPKAIGSTLRVMLFPQRHA